MLKTLKSRFGTSIKRLLSTPADSRVDAHDDRPPPRHEAARDAADTASRAQRQKRLRLRLMRRDLFGLLEQHAESRRLMPHLALVERALRKEGLAAVEALPRPVLNRALLQLESLVQDWSPQGLADVRSRIAVMLRDRPALSGIDMNPDQTIDDELADLGEGLEVTVDLEDVSDTDQAAFAEMERSWAGRMPTGVATAFQATHSGG